MIIVAGTIRFAPECIEELLTRCKPLIEGGLEEDGCLNYEWCPNPLVPGEILVFERWRDQASLQAHFDCKWYKDMGAALNCYPILEMDVLKYQSDRYEPVYDETGTPRADFFSVS